MTFRVGQKVTMIKPWAQGPTCYHETFTEFGEIYTVRENLMVDHYPAIRVAEIVNAPHIYHKRGRIELPFPAYNFRPIVERKTDISALKALLVPGAKIREDA